MSDAPGGLRGVDDDFVVAAVPEFAEAFVVGVGKVKAVVISEGFVGADDDG